jgi:hypothetical protein
MKYSFLIQTGLVSIFRRENGDAYLSGSLKKSLTSFTVIKDDADIP